MRAPSSLAVATTLIAFSGMMPAALDHAPHLQDRQQAPESALADPQMVLTHARGRLEISGVSASADHEARLQQIAADTFGGVVTAASFETGVLLPKDWEAASAHIVRTLAVTESGTAIMNSGRVAIRGVTADAVELQARLDALQAALNETTELQQDFAVVDTSASIATLCRRSLAYAASQPIAFSRSTAELRTSSYPVLDKVVETASDCRGSTIFITGHSDASGDENANQLLSLQRAQSVANYIIDAGIDKARLVVAGRGSSVPVADNTTAQGRSRNRRIEFDLR
jgi:OOP family OmpA-OmpF porin